MQQGSQTMNVARRIALRAGLPVTVPGMSIDRQCSSGLMTIATAAKQIIVDRQDIAVAGGIESISKVSGSGKIFIETDAELIAMHKETYMPMIRSEEHTSELQSLMRRSYAVSRLKKKKKPLHNKLSRK